MPHVRSELFEELVGRWLRYVLVRFHRAKVLLVATHADLVERSQNNVERLSARVLADAHAFLAEFMAAIEKDIRNIESNRSISSALSVYFTEWTVSVRVRLHGLRIVHHVA